MTAITKEDIIAILEAFTQEMENYSYFSSNPGISESDYEDVAERIIEKIEENSWTPFRVV